MFINNKFLARKHFLNIRKSIVGDERQQAEKLIFQNFINSHYFNDFETILCYVSVDDEVDTRKIINYCIESGKNVYIPECVGNEMSFYKLDSLACLIQGKFGIPTVDTEEKAPLGNFGNTLCIVPGLSFDKYGCRIGYGGGYYDRFLEDNETDTLGLTFDKCLCDTLPKEELDKSVKAVLTESGLKISESF